MKILADADLPYLSQCFPKPFEIATYKSHQELQKLLPSHDVLLCRSTLRVNQALLENSRIQCVATASSGTDHIDQEYLKSQYIHLIDAKGSNAHAVADYVTASIAWLETHRKIAGKMAGLIGAGAVGTQVLRRLSTAGYDVKIYDPFKLSTGSVPHVDSLAALSQCDLLCVHPNLHHCDPYPSANLINEAFLSTLKPGVAIINGSRGGVVNERDLLGTHQPIHYCTDVFMGEPDIDPQIINFATLCTPHIAGHSIEAKQRAIMQISEELHRLFSYPTPSVLNTTTEQDFDLTKITHWQTYVLNLYNPYEDTLILKTQMNKTTAFQTRRKAHTHRHNFVNRTELCYI